MTRQTIVAAALMAGVAATTVRAAERPNNPVGVHLMIHDIRTDEIIDNHTAWARRVCGPWGYVKTFEHGITPETPGPSDSLIKLVRTLYERELIPVIRLGGIMEDDIWQRPVDTPDGTFGDVAEALKRVVAGLPRSDHCPLYIEVWNEPNLALEWSGQTRPADFARFYLRTARAIRTIGDPRIQVAPGGLSPGGDYNSLQFIDAMCAAEPEFVHSFDYWATHPYPGATPPQDNIHDKTTTAKFACIDLWMYELQRLAAHGCNISKLKVIGTETGYRLGLGGGKASPIIDRPRRADYHLRAFRDYWMSWPEVLGMCIWDFANPFQKQTGNTWVHADSITDETGWPSRPARDFHYVAALAKPTTDYACVSGQFLDARTGGGIPDVNVTLAGTDLSFTTDSFGNFILSPVDPEHDAAHVVHFTSGTHGRGSLNFSAKKGQNVVLNRQLQATAWAALSGHVVNTQTGKPLADALVTVEPGHFGTRSNHAGSFEFDNLPHGYYTVVVARDGFYPHCCQATRLPAGRVTKHRYRLGPGTEVAGNLLTNVGFERAEPGANTALGWGSHGPDDALSIDRKTVYAGDHAQRINAIAGETPGVVQWTGYTTITPSKRYRLQCWVRTTGVKAVAGKGARLAGTVVTNPHKTLMEVQSDTTLIHDQPWTLLTAEFTAPADSGRVSLQIELEADAGTCWADEAAVLPLLN